MIIVDSSVALQWVLPEEGSALAEELLGRTDLLAPDVILIEVANVLGKKVRAKDMSGEGASKRLRFVRESIPRLQPTVELVDRALQLSVELTHGVYDCAFLACALASKSVVVSRDTPFVERATKRGYGAHVRLYPDAELGP